MTKKTGGPAFPVFPETGGGHAGAFHGMSLRDYFAAKAMQGFISQATWTDKEFLGEAEAAYRVADAMLKARDQ